MQFGNTGVRPRIHALLVSHGPSYERFWGCTDWGVNTPQVTETGMWTLLGTYRLGDGPPGVTQTGVWTPVGHPDWVVEIPWLTQSQVWSVRMSISQSVTPLESPFIFVNTYVPIVTSHPIISDCRLYFTNSDHSEVLISLVGTPLLYLSSDQKATIARIFTMSLDLKFRQRGTDGERLNLTTVQV